MDFPLSAHVLSGRALWKLCLGLFQALRLKCLYTVRVCTCFKKPSVIWIMQCFSSVFCNVQQLCSHPSEKFHQMFYHGDQLWWVISLSLTLSGMFANAEGISQRAPVKWSENVIGAAVCFPYVVALDEGFVTVHSMLDQQLKQTLSFRGGCILQHFEGWDSILLYLHSWTRFFS